MALSGTDTSSLLEILQVHFGCVASSESDEEEDILVEAEKTSGTTEVIVRPKQMGDLATAELIFPFKSSPLLLQTLPKIFTSLWPQNPIPLPMSGPPM